MFAVLRLFRVLKDASACFGAAPVCLQSPLVLQQFGEVGAAIQAGTSVFTDVVVAEMLKMCEFTLCFIKKFHKN